MLLELDFSPWLDFAMTVISALSIIIAFLVSISYHQKRINYRQLGRNRTIDEFTQQETISKPKLTLLAFSKKIKPIIIILSFSLVLSFILSFMVIDSKILSIIFTNPKLFIIVGLLCDIIGAIMIILPVLFLVEVKTFRNNLEDNEEEDEKQLTEIEDFDRLNQKLARIGIIILSSGFGLQITGNLMY